MMLSKNSSSHWRLYVIIDRDACGTRDPLKVAAAAIRGDADVIQLRDKSSSRSQLLDMARRMVRRVWNDGRRVLPDVTGMELDALEAAWLEVVEQSDATGIEYNSHPRE